MEYKINDCSLDAVAFISFANAAWKGDYDVKRTEQALSKTLNITAYDENRLVGCLRILTDGYYFGTITELLVLPQYQKQGIGSKLLQLEKNTRPPFYILARSREWKRFTKRIAAKKFTVLYHRKNI